MFSYKILCKVKFFKIPLTYKINKQTQIYWDMPINCIYLYKFIYQPKKYNHFLLDLKTLFNLQKNPPKIIVYSVRKMFIYR